jgi:alpha-mannosidase
LVDNGILKVAFSANGQIIGLYDYEARREVAVASQPLNVFKIYEDIPLFWDAWDVVYTDLG